MVGVHFMNFPLGFLHGYEFFLKRHPGGYHGFFLIFLF